MAAEFLLDADLWPPWPGGLSDVEGYTDRVHRSSRWFVMFTGVLCLAVGIAFALFWEEVAIRYHLYRLRSEPDYLLAVLLDRRAEEDAWAGPLRSDAGHMAESPKHSLAWAAVRELMKSEEGRRAFAHALQSADYEAALVASIEKLQRRLLQENRVPLE